jgi:DNA-binding HxlR family transcriptional regulator
MAHFCAYVYLCIKQLKMYERKINQQLKELEEFNVLTKKIYHQLPPKVEYSLSEFFARLIQFQIICKKNLGNRLASHIFATE